MPCLVEGQIETVHLSQFTCQHDKVSPAIKIEHLVPLLLVTVFLNNPQRYIQQADRGRRICLLPAYMNPPRTVIGSCDITCRQPFQVRVSQPRESGENEHVPHELQLRFLHGSFHKFFEVFQLHVAALPSW